MSQIPSIRSIREAILEQSRQGASDSVGLMTLQQDFETCARGIRKALDRATEFAQRGLRSEAASVIEDFPDLLRQAEALRTLSASDPIIAQIWSQHLAPLASRLALPTQSEVDGLASISIQTQEHKTLLDALRLSALRREPLTARLRILRRLRAAEQNNRMWLDQIESLETAWLKQLADLRHAQGVSREELEEALSSLESREWIASIPRGLRDELAARVAPMRAETARERYAALAREIHDAAARMDRDELVRLEAAWANTNLDTGRMPDPVLAETVQPAFRWLTNLETQERERASHSEQVAALETMLGTDASAEDIEVQIRRLGGSQFGAPEELLVRAEEVLRRRRTTARLRRQVLIASGVFAVIAVAAAALFGMRMYQLSSQRQQQLAALEAAIDAKKLEDVQRLAGEIRAGGLDGSAEITSALARADEFTKGRSQLAADASKSLDEVAAELDQSPGRERVVAMKGVLDLARTTAGRDDQARLEELERRRAERLQVLDLEAEKSAKLAIEDARQSLKQWKPIDAWAGAAQTDPRELNRYIEALQATREQLAGAATDTKSLGAASNALQAEVAAIDAQLESARARSDALAAALQDLEPSRLCAPIANEGEFIARLVGAVSKHGEVLARSGRLPMYEEATRAVAAWESIRAWREELYPQLVALLGPGLETEPAPGTEAQLTQLIEGYLRRHMASPYAKTLKAMQSRFSSPPVEEVWSIERVSEQLDVARLAELEQVPLGSGGWFYRRPQAGVDPRNRAVENLADLLETPDRLDSILTVKPGDIAGKPVPNDISVAWGDAMRRLSSAPSTAVGKELVKLLVTAADSKSDALLRLRALRDVSELLANSGHMPGALAKPLNTWRESLDSSARNALAADWLRAGLEPEINFRNARREATQAIGRFPDAQRLLADAEGQQVSAARRLRPMMPWGVVEPHSDMAAPRTVIGRNESGRFQAAVRTSSEWEFVELTVESGVVTRPAGLFEGPILLFKPADS